MGQNINSGPQIKKLLEFTKARLGLSDPDGVVATSDHLKLKESLAKAKDAIGFQIDWKSLQKKFTKQLPTYKLESQAKNREIYLMRPQLGRSLSTESVQLLNKSLLNKDRIDFVISDGLSPLGIQNYALDLCGQIQQYIPKDLWGQAYLIENGRVAISDAIAEICPSLVTIVIVGERPGLSSFDSVGAYITYRPKVGRQDSNRNCISNICDSGLPVELAAKRIAYFVYQTLQLKQSGIAIKENDGAIDSAIASLKLLGCKN